MSRLALAEELGVDTTELAKHLRWIREKGPVERENILDRADKTIPMPLALKAIRLVQELCYLKEFCTQAGVDYNSIKEEDSRMIKTALADYLMR